MRNEAIVFGSFIAAVGCGLNLCVPDLRWKSNGSYTLQEYSKGVSSCESRRWAGRPL